MNENLTNDFEVRLATLEAMGVDATGYSTIFEVDKAILEATLEGGGGGGEGVTPAQVRTIVEGYDYVSNPSLNERDYVSNASLNEKGYAKDASLGDYYKKVDGVTIYNDTTYSPYGGSIKVADGNSSTYIKAGYINSQYTTSAGTYSMMFNGSYISVLFKDQYNVQTITRIQPDSITVAGETVATQAYVDDAIGDINTALEAIIGA